MKLKFKRDVVGCFNHLYQKNEVIEYHPWNFTWQEMREPNRVRQGIFVHCHGQGEFDVFRNDDVEVLSE